MEKINTNAACYMPTMSFFTFCSFTLLTREVEKGRGGEIAFRGGLIRETGLKRRGNPYSPLELLRCSHKRISVDCWELGSNLVALKSQCIKNAGGKGKK